MEARVSFILDYGQPIERLLYKGVDIWDAISSQVVSLTYTDNIGDQADEIQIQLRNDHHRWLDAWFPEHGDELRGFLGYRGGRTLDMGTFFLDQPAASGDRSGDMFSIRGQSKPVDKAAKTKKTKAFENKSQKQIAEEVLGELGMSIVGTPPEITFQRITQRRENGLEFLARLASDYGAFFAVKGRSAVYANRDDLFAQTPVRILRRGDRSIIRYNLKHDSSGTASKAKASYFDGNTKKNIEVEVEDKQVKTGDTLRTDDRVENKGQAEKLAKSKLQKANMKAWSADFEIVGDPSCQAGQIVQLVGYGRWDRTYIIDKARHHDVRTAYTTNVSLKDARKSA
jgi:phage protein D